MENKVKVFLKENLRYTIFFISLLIVTLGIATTTYEYDDFSLQLPFKTLYGSIIYGIVIGVSIFAYIFFSKKNFKKLKLENLYLLIALPVGILYCIANPLGKVPDEDFHARKAVAISQGNFFSIADKDRNAMEGVNSKLPIVVDRTICSYNQALERISIPQTDEIQNVNYNTMALYSPICHLPQAIGIIIVKIFSSDIVIQLYGGRIINMLFSIAMIYFSIKLIPFKKIIVIFLGLLPITMNEIASLSSDAITISICIFYISYILHLKYMINKYTKKEIIILTISTFIVALVKIVYLPLCLLLFILPKEKFASVKQRDITLILLITLAIVSNLIWLIYCSRFLVEFNPGVNSVEQTKYVLTHPITYIIIVFRTIVVYFQNFIVCLNGEGLGHYNAQASVLYVFSSILLFAFLFFVKDKEDYDEIKINLTTKIICAMVFIMTIALIFSSIYVQWNKVAYQLVLGIQGRYFLPIILLTAIIFDNTYFLVKEKISKRYIYIFMLFFNLNALSNIVFTYISGHPIEYLVK